MRKSTENRHRLQMSDGNFNPQNTLLAKLNQNIENVVKLFFLTQKIIRKKLRKLEKIQNCSVGFLAQFSNKVRYLKASLNENIENISSSEDSVNFEDMEDENKKEQEEADEILMKILEGEEIMQNGFEEAKKIMNFLEEFLIKTNKASTKSYLQDPNLILRDVNVDDFLKKTREFFDNEKIEIFKGINNKVKLLEIANSRLENEYSDLIEAIENDPSGNGLRNSIKRIIDLQKEIKYKDVTISNLELANEKLFKNLQICQNNLKNGEDDEEDTQVENLKKENQGLQHELKKLVKRLQEQEEENRERESLKNQLDAAYNKINDLKQVKEDQYNAMLSLQDKVIYLQEAMNKSKQTQMSLQQENFTLKSSVGQRSESENLEDPGEKDILSRKLIGMEEENQILKNKNLELEAQIEAARENESYNTADESHYPDIQLTQKLEEAESEVSNLSMKMKFFEDKVDHFKKTNSFLEEKLKEYQESHGQILEENERLKIERERMKLEKKTLLEEIEEGGKGNGASKISNIFQENETLKSDIFKLNSTLEEVRKKMNALLIDNKTLREHNKDLLKKMRKSSSFQLQRRNSDGHINSNSEEVEKKLGGILDEKMNLECLDYVNMIFIQTKMIEELFKINY